MTPPPHPVTDVRPYQLFMLTLCLWALTTLGVGSFFRLDPETQTILDYADVCICGLFFLDFLYSLYWAPRKLYYLRTWGWIDLLSSVPTVAALRWGRAARVMRILRVLRGVRSARALAHFLVARRAQSAFLASMLLALLINVVGSIAILQFEVEAGGNIQNAEDALWWAISTTTTVGYGDRFPITSEGRVIASFLMAAGVGAFGSISGLVVSWFLSPEAQVVDSELAQVKQMLSDIREHLNRTSDRQLP